MSKFLSIKICNIISKKPGYNYKTLVPTNLYGPNDNYDLEKSHLLAAIIKKLSDAKKMRKNMLKYGGMVKQGENLCLSQIYQMLFCFL